MCRVCYMPSWYGPSWLCAEFAMCRVDPASVENWIIKIMSIIYRNYRQVSTSTPTASHTNGKYANCVIIQFFGLGMCHLYALAV